jgi:hypothetical protein
MFTPSSYSLLPNLTEIAHTQRVPYSEQLLHIQHRLYVFGRLRKEKKNGRHSPTPHPASFSFFTQKFSELYAFFGGGGNISKFSKIKGRKSVISEKLILTVDFFGGGNPPTAKMPPHARFCFSGA